MSSDGDDGGGGTFWSSFGKTAGADAEGTPLERLLQSPDCSVEALLDEEDVIQEFKAQNDRLVSRLCKPDAAKALIEYITCEPPDGSSHERCFRYPFVAVELMTCGADAFFEAFIKPDHPELMDTFWGFLEVSPPAKVNPVLAGYFARTAAALLAKHRCEVVEHLRYRGSDALLDRFLDRLHLRSIAELFARLLCAEQAFQITFPVEGLIERILSRLLDSVPANDTQENVALITLELLAQKETLIFSDDLLRQLTSSKVVSLLVDGVFCGRAGSVVASAAILSSIVSHTDVATSGGGASSIAGSTPTLSPLSPPMAPPPLSGHDDVVNVGDDIIDRIECEVAVRTSSPPSSPTNASRADPPASVLDRGAVLIREICTHIPRIRTLLDAALNPGAPTVLQMPVGAANAVGSTTLEVVNLLTMLVRTGSPLVFEALLQDELLPRCLELFFRHRWSSLLHNAVRLLLSEVLSGTEGQRPTLVLRLLQEGGLAERLVSEYEAEWELCKMGEGLKQRHPRVGYMGHLHAMCTELRVYGAQVHEVDAALTSARGWTDWVVPALEATAKIQSEALGGGIPDEDRGLASSNVPSAGIASSGLSAVRSNLEDTDFVLNPLDEDADDDLGGLHLPSSDTDPHAPDAADAAGGSASAGDGPPVFSVLGSVSSGGGPRPDWRNPGSSSQQARQPPTATDNNWAVFLPEVASPNVDDWDPDRPWSEPAGGSAPSPWLSDFRPEPVLPPDGQGSSSAARATPPAADPLETASWASFQATFEANHLPASGAPQSLDRNDRSWVADFDPFCQPASSPSPGAPSSGGYGGGAAPGGGGGDQPGLPDWVLRPLGVPALAAPEEKCSWTAHFPDPPFEAPPPPPQRPNEPDEDPLPFIHTPGAGRSATTAVPSSTSPPPATGGGGNDLPWWPADFPAEQAET